MRTEDCGCERDGLYYLRNESFWVADGNGGSDCSQYCTCGPDGEISCVNDSCTEGEICMAELGRLGCYPRREGVCSVSQNQVLSTFDGATLAFPNENSYFLLKPCGALPPNVSAVEVKIGRKLMNKGPTWVRPIMARVVSLEAQLGGSDFDVVKVSAIIILNCMRSCKNGGGTVAEEAARLPHPFWAEGLDSTCYEDF